jgi:5-methylcytosine-specific restriction endonuclease McrA
VKHYRWKHQYEKARKYVLAQSNICWLCGMPGATTVDHVIPRSHGGEDNVENLRPAHLRCNSSRGNRTPVQRRTTRQW